MVKQGLKKTNPGQEHTKNLENQNQKRPKQKTNKGQYLPKTTKPCPTKATNSKNHKTKTKMYHNKNREHENYKRSK